MTEPVGELVVTVAGHEWAGTAWFRRPLVLARLYDAERPGCHRDYAVLAVCGSTGRISVRHDDAFVSGIRDADGRHAAEDFGEEEALHAEVVVDVDTMALIRTGNLQDAMRRADEAPRSLAAIAQLRLGRFEDAAASAESFVGRVWRQPEATEGKSLIQQLADVGSAVKNAVMTHPADAKQVKDIADHFQRLAGYFANGEPLAEFASFLTRNQI
ncbi:MAG: hypothetical protein HOW97_00345 [Catenulispora sp.]|nr:hypothetical protein [Catenulispora sp.]